jgi:hypothetical protein
MDEYSGSLDWESNPGSMTRVIRSVPQYPARNPLVMNRVQYRMCNDVKLARRSIIWNPP